jgi:nitrite reductase (NADH) large subunit
VFSAGKVEREAGDEEIVLSDPRRSIYRRVLLRDDVLVGSECLGTESLSAWHTELLESGAKVTGFRSHLLFGKPERESVAA